MKHLLIPAATFCLLAATVSAQGPKSEEERQKALFDSIDKEVDRLTSLLDLEDWQIFRLDSTLVHDYTALNEEIKTLSMSKVSNVNAYQKVQDKWQEQIYNSNRSILNDEQWAKYLKQGAAREKKARDKRALK